MTLSVKWLDRGRDPQCAPDPAYPDGKDVDVSDGAAVTCETALPYPAKRVGIFIVECPTCGYRAAITTAGRPDDPRSAKIPCQAQRATSH